MNILILGGTRFIGKKVVENLAVNKHNLTILSRHLHNFPSSNVKQICKERSQGLLDLKGQYFDLTLDFICYVDYEPLELISVVNTKIYLLVSSIWVPRLWGGIKSNEILASTIYSNTKYPKETIDYLKGKYSAEQSVLSLRKKGINAVILRLPIVLGEGDHTNRFYFYPSRLIDGRPIILINGGYNIAQIANVNDIANVISKWIDQIDITSSPIWEALPGNGRDVRSIIELIALQMKIKANLLEISFDELSQKLPDYLISEPFWRETFLAVSATNIYLATNSIPSFFMSEYDTHRFFNTTITNPRLKELEFLGNR